MFQPCEIIERCRHCLLSAPQRVEAHDPGLCTESLCPVLSHFPVSPLVTISSLIPISNQTTGVSRSVREASASVTTACPVLPSPPLPCTMLCSGVCTCRGPLLCGRWAWGCRLWLLLGGESGFVYQGLMDPEWEFCHLCWRFGLEMLKSSVFPAC